MKYIHAREGCTGILRRNAKWGSKEKKMGNKQSIPMLSFIASASPESAAHCDLV